MIPNKTLKVTYYIKKNLNMYIFTAKKTNEHSWRLMLYMNKLINYKYRRSLLESVDNKFECYKHYASWHNVFSCTSEFHRRQVKLYFTILCYTLGFFV